MRQADQRFGKRVAAVTRDDQERQARQGQPLGKVERHVAVKVEIDDRGVDALRNDRFIGALDRADGPDGLGPRLAQRLAKVVGEEIFVFDDEDPIALERIAGRRHPQFLSCLIAQCANSTAVPTRNVSLPRSLGGDERRPLANRDIIAIGGSAGSSAVLQQVMADLPADLPASLFVTTHVPSQSASYVANMLARTAKLRVVEAIDGQPIERGCVYVAVPDHHLLVIDGTVRLGDGPRENMARPAIDPLFRSAALSYGSRAVGVVLSGLLNDGAAGLWAIKACGGTAVVQQPLDAQADQMPLAALETVEVDEVAAAKDLGAALIRIAQSTAGESLPLPDSVPLEVQIAGGARLGSQALREIADPSALSCPDCQGVLSEVRDEEPLRFRCQTGHAYTAEVLANRREEVDEAMRIALRIMEERVTLVRRTAEDARRTGRNAVADLYQERVREYSGYADTLRAAATAAMRDSDPIHEPEE